MSTLTWLDSSERDRRSVMELVSALNEPGTLDELGIGTIRDTIADKLFLRHSVQLSRLVQEAVDSPGPSSSSGEKSLMWMNHAFGR